MLDEQLIIPDSLPNLAGYYDKAVKAFFQQPMQRWTITEIDKLSEILGRYAVRNKLEYCNQYNKRQTLEIPSVTSIMDDIEIYGLPRNVCLIKWLSVEGLASQVPKLISEISRTFL